MPRPVLSHLAPSQPRIPWIIGPPAPSPGPVRPAPTLLQRPVPLSRLRLIRLETHPRRTQATTARPRVLGSRATKRRRPYHQSLETGLSSHSKIVAPPATRPCSVCRSVFARPPPIHPSITMQVPTSSAPTHPSHWLSSHTCRPITPLVCVPSDKASMLVHMFPDHCAINTGALPFPTPVLRATNSRAHGLCCPADIRHVTSDRKYVSGGLAGALLAPLACHVECRNS